MVCSNATKGDGLAASLDLFHESILGESAIVSVVVLDGHSNFSGIRFKSRFGFKGLFSSGAFRDMNICET